PSVETAVPTRSQTQFCCPSRFAFERHAVCTNRSNKWRRVAANHAARSLAISIQSLRISDVHPSSSRISQAPTVEYSTLKRSDSREHFRVSIEMPSGEGQAMAMIRMLV